MAVKFFGQFLLERGAVPADLLLQAIDLQEKTNRKFGDVAVEMELLTPAQVAQVHQAQRLEDMKFGEMAVKIGALTEEQVGQVLTMQRNNRIYIGEALVQLGALGEDDLKRHLADFQADQAPYLVSEVTLPEGLPHSRLVEITADLTYKLLARMTGAQFRQGACRVVRRIDSGDVVALMDFSGSVNGRYVMSVPASLQEAIARCILEEDDLSGESEEVLDDAVKEFINIVCGNIAAKAAKIGLTLEIAPPLSYRVGGGGFDVPAGQTGILIPIHLSDGATAAAALFLKR